MHSYKVNLCLLSAFNIFFSCWTNLFLTSGEALLGEIKKQSVSVDSAVCILKKSAQQIGTVSLTCLKCLSFLKDFLDGTLTALYLKSFIKFSEKYSKQPIHFKWYSSS